ncbi:RmlC-like cupin domain-containing protein [Pisolithus marmoratus]|nr:RmlC-like cupin domain-containing protein [Pisolithus marmoratus]
MPNNPVQIIPRWSTDRGHADHGWLKTFHTFSFANYHDPRHSSYGALRVINEDRVASGTGFGTHSHQNFEIFSYVVGGQLEHQDSMGNTEILSRGALQSTSAGTGIAHSEKAHGPEEVHFLQIWASPRPGDGNKKPAYFTRNFCDEEKRNRFLLVVAPDDSSVSLSREDKGPAPIRSHLWMYASLIDPGVSLVHEHVGKGQGQLKKGYIHLIQTSGYNARKSSGNTVRIGSKSTDGDSKVELREGDGAYLIYEGSDNLEVTNVGQGIAEVLLFDLD